MFNRLSQKAKMPSNSNFLRPPAVSALVGTVLAAADVPAAGTPHQFADLRTLVHVCVASRGVIIEPTTQFFEPRPFSDS
jgi:hypothetical protein